MKIIEIAARLRTVAANMEVLAIREGDLDYPDEMVLPFLANDNVLRFAKAPCSPENPRE